MRNPMTKTNKKVFTRKDYTPNLYKWSPENISKTVKKDVKTFFCSAKAGTQGEDWTTSYVYDIVVTNGIQKRLAYVECDYVM